ncbi:unnamed protein product [Durusdinium trenchii]|uniref:Ubiquitin-like domain-containing protein n=1 Tax=Durusdinium trenchii TaxID=1381693 RepID=A0ABP0N6Y8_9DINO
MGRGFANLERLRSWRRRMDKLRFNVHCQPPTGQDKVITFRIVLSRTDTVQKLLEDLQQKVNNHPEAKGVVYERVRLPQSGALLDDQDVLGVSLADDERDLDALPTGQAVVATKDEDWVLSSCLQAFLPKNEDQKAHNLLPCPVGTQLHVGGRDGRGWLLCEAISSGLTGFVPEWVLEKAEPNSQPSSIVVHSPKSALAEHRAESTNNRPGKHIGKVCRIEAMTGAYVDRVSFYMRDGAKHVYGGDGGVHPQIWHLAEDEVILEAHHIEHPHREFLATEIFLTSSKQNIVIKGWTGPGKKRPLKWHSFGKRGRQINELIFDDSVLTGIRHMRQGNFVRKRKSARKASSPTAGTTALVVKNQEMVADVGMEGWDLLREGCVRAGSLVAEEPKVQVDMCCGSMSAELSSWRWAKPLSIIVDQQA